MADTILGEFKGSCSDCGSDGCTVQHWGPLVQHGKYGTFCDPCWKIRVEEHRAGEKPKPFKRPFGYKKEKHVKSK
jgi:hypothetical protein